MEKRLKERLGKGQGRNGEGRRKVYEKADEGLREGSRKGKEGIEETAEPCNKADV